MKKVLFQIVVVMVFMAITACNKEQTVSSINGIPGIESPQNVEAHRIVDPSQVVNAIALEYGDAYDFDDLICVSHNDNRSVGLYIAPYVVTTYDIYITFILGPSANILGLYEFQITSGLDKNDRYDSYGFTVTNLYDADFYEMFSGDMILNYLNYPDRVYIYNNYYIDPDYPYPLFDNISSGYSNVANYFMNPDTLTESERVALTAAATFYSRFCGN